MPVSECCSFSWKELAGSSQATSCRKGGALSEIPKPIASLSRLNLPKQHSPSPSALATRCQSVLRHFVNKQHYRRSVLGKHNCSMLNGSFHPLPCSCPQDHKFSRSRKQSEKRRSYKCQASFSWRFDEEEEECDERGVCTPAGLKTFQEGRALFNQREFYKCHDVLEGLWHISPEPQRSVLHGILQCAVGLYHLQNQNHRGALIQFGEGIQKLRRQRLQEGNLHEFEQEMAALLEFVYNTQLENAACDEDECVAMTGDDESYRLLGNFGAGEPMYRIQEDTDGNTYLQFSMPRQDKLLAQGFDQQRVLLPRLRASEADLLALSRR